MPRKSLILCGESAGIRTQDPRLKRASELAALTNDQVRLSAKNSLLNDGLQEAECAGLRLQHTCDRDQNRARTVTKTVTSPPAHKSNRDLEGSQVTEIVER